MDYYGGLFTGYFAWILFSDLCIFRFGNSSKQKCLEKSYLGDVKMVCAEFLKIDPFYNSVVVTDFVKLFFVLYLGLYENNYLF